MGVYEQINRISLQHVAFSVYSFLTVLVFFFGSLEEV